MALWLLDCLALPSYKNIPVTNSQMELYQTVNHDFKRLEIEKKLPFFQNVHDSMSKVGSPFPSPETTYAAGNTQIGLFKAAQVAAENRTKGFASLMHDAIRDTEVVMDSWADYVDSIALGNKAIIELSGFDPTAETSTPGKVTEQPIVVSKNPDVAGVMAFEFGLLDGVSIVYNIIVATDVSGVSQVGNEVILSPVAGVTYYTCSTMQRKLRMAGLPKYTKLYALCYTTNRTGNSVLSKIIDFSC